MRHGEAGRGSSDHQRPLTSSGTEACRAVAQHVASKGWGTMHVLSSDSVQTRERCSLSTYAHCLCSLILHCFTVHVLRALYSTLSLTHSSLFSWNAMQDSLEALSGVSPLSSSSTRQSPTTYNLRDGSSPTLCLKACHLVMSTRVMTRVYGIDKCLEILHLLLNC